MTIEFKIRATEPLGNHKRLSVFTRTAPAKTWANCGALMMTAFEADAFKAALNYTEWTEE